MIIRLYQESDRQTWDKYVYNHPEAYHTHLIGWKDIIEKTYRKKAYYLVAEDNTKIKGILPLFYIKSILFGSQLVSMPYLTYGGILADSNEIIKLLIEKAISISEKLSCESLELRQVKAFSSDIAVLDKLDINKTKVSMRLDLPETSEELFNSFKAKLRSQIRRPQKEGMIFKLGSEELIGDFYKVFTVNMRDLGSPVHSKKLFVELLNSLRDTIKIGVVYYKKIPVASGIITLFNDYVEIPWASSLREYNRFSPNMLLYWGFLEYVSNNKFKVFDFGRSTPGEGTYKFKKQWGSLPTRLNWYQMSYLKKNSNHLKYNQKKNIFIKIWSRLPIFSTKYLGPMLRKDISL